MLDRDKVKSGANQAGPKDAAAKKLSRRTLLKGAAAVAGAAAGSDAIRGFPTIWAQEIKDIELRHVGVSYSVVKAIGDQAAKDLGFNVTMQNLDTSAAINRFISQPNTVDIADLEGWQAKLAAKRGVIQGIEVRQGRLSRWCNGMGLMKHLSGKKLDAAYEYLNWYLSGWQGGFVARYGYYSPVPSTAKKFLTPAEWAFWYEGQPAPEVINDPYGVAMEKSGTKRDGGSFLDRVKNISCWNTLMDEAAYMNKRWNDFKVA